MSLTLDPRTPGRPLPPGPSVAAAGDSVVLTALLNDNCARWSVRAGLADGALVVTVVDSLPAEGRLCAAVASVGHFRAVVRPAPRGRYDAVLRERVITSSQGARERELVRRRVVVR